MTICKSCVCWSFKKSNWSIINVNPLYLIDYQYFVNSIIFEQTKLFELSKYILMHSRAGNESSRIELVWARLDLIRICSARVQNELFFQLEFDSFKVHEQFGSARCSTQDRRELFFSFQARLESNSWTTRFSSITRIKWTMKRQRQLWFIWPQKQLTNLIVSWSKNH